MSKPTMTMTLFSAVLVVGACSVAPAPLDSATPDAGVDASSAAEMDGAVPDGASEPTDASSTPDAGTDPVTAATRWLAALQAAAETACACDPPLPPYTSAEECLAESSWEGEPGDCLVREYGTMEHLEQVLCFLPHAEDLAECVRAADCDATSTQACYRAYSEAGPTCPSTGGPSCMP